MACFSLCTWRFPPEPSHKPMLVTVDSRPYVLLVATMSCMYLRICLVHGQSCQCVTSQSCCYPKTFFTLLPFRTLLAFLSRLGILLTFHFSSLVRCLFFVCFLPVLSVCVGVVLAVLPVFSPSQYLPGLTAFDDVLPYIVGCPCKLHHPAFDSSAKSIHYYRTM